MEEDLRPSTSDDGEEEEEADDLAPSQSETNGKENTETAFSESKESIAENLLADPHLESSKISGDPEDDDDARMSDLIPAHVKKALAPSESQKEETETKSILIDPSKHPTDASVLFRHKSVSINLASQEVKNKLEKLASEETVEEQAEDEKTVSMFPAIVSRRSSRTSADKQDDEDFPPTRRNHERSKSLSEERYDAATRRRSTVSGDIASTASGRRRSTVYNPFTSFEKHVSITEPDEVKQLFQENARPRLSIRDIEFKDLKSPSQADHLPPVKKRSVSVADISKNDIAVCFFPELPEWDDDDDKTDTFFPPAVFRFNRETNPTLPPFGKDEEDPLDDRDQWSSRMLYLVAMISYSISFSNIYHFPMLVYHYGGIPFLIPYTLFTIILAYPLHFVECSLGQYSQLGPIKVWDCAPIARGIGLSMVFLSIFIGYFYNMYAAYAVIYFPRCFNSILPWKDCVSVSDSPFHCIPRMCTHENNTHYTPSEHYFLEHILQTTPANEILENGLGPMIWMQVLGSFLAWAVVYAATIQSIRSIEKTLFYCLILPYFVLLMLFSAGFMLEGSDRGFALLFGPNFDNLLDFQLWRSAAEEVFFELGICQGTLLTFSSYCRHHNPIHIDSAVVCMVNYVTSVMCALIVFNILGTLSLELQTEVSNIIHYEPALVYIVYPEAISRIPGSQFWCVAFFVMVFSVCIGTQTAIVETVLSVIYDEFETARPYRWVINLAFCSAMFLIGLTNCTANGFFIVYLLHRMVAMMPRLPIAICISITVVFIYGTKKYCEDMQFMINYYPNIFIRFCLFLIPFYLLPLTVVSWINQRPISINGRDYVIDAIIVAYIIIGLILIWIILGGIYWCTYCRYIGHPNYVWKSLASWGPRDFPARLARIHFSSQRVLDSTTRKGRK